MTELSPACAAVLDAADNVRYDIDWWPEGMPQLIAAALRAAADQVVPGDGSRRANEIRSEFLSIADELEAQ